MTTLAGNALLSMCLTVPRVGLWVLDAQTDNDTLLTGDVDFVVAGRTWRGTVVRGGAELGRWSGRVVGAGALAGLLGPLPFASATLAEVLTETAREAGVTLADGLGDLSATVPRWHRIAAPASHTVADVARAAGYVWRALAAGTLGLGAETWAPLALASGVDVIGHDPRVGRFPH